MLFNSFAFLFLYLPIVLCGFFLLARTGARAPAVWLALASLFFYGYWELRFLPLLLGSIIINYFSAQSIMRAIVTARKRRMIQAVVLNLLLLAYFKYTNFFISSVNSTGIVEWPLRDIVLPIGISFFTFTQIAFLVDCYHGKVRELRFVHYVLFVSYFPHLVAGPVLHHAQMMPQFARPETYQPRASNFAIGLSVFVVGLAKKVLIADNISPLVAPVFAAGAHPGLIEAWIGVLAYTFQLYFDFSGYSDMAIGLSRLFGVKLPLNFNSPYKAENISQFWRRWHMTLSCFLRDYLYIALGGNRGGQVRRYRNVLLTMLLGGLWHGAGWTFVVWGALHGTYLMIHQLWHTVAAGARVRETRWWAWVGRAATFLCVVFAWVFFRAETLPVAFDVLSGMFGGNGVALPHGFARYAAWFPPLPSSFSFTGLRWIDAGGVGLPMLALAMLLAFFAPNTQEIFGHFGSLIEGGVHPLRPPSIAWMPKPAWSLTFAGLFIACVLSLNRVTEFLYFQF